MTNVTLRSFAVLSIAGSLALAGCSGDETNNNNNSGVPDSGVTNNNNNSNNNSNNNNTNNNNTNNNNGDVDAGVADSGPPPPCPPGTEGCSCTSNIGPNDSAFLQDDCEADLLCVPFDLITGRQDLTGPVQSCVKPCSTDADCGSGQTCVESGFGEDSGAGSICADRVAGYDEFCGFSKGLTSRVPDVQLNTSGEIVGCPQGYDCSIGTFSDVHPDEGICIQFCEGNDECGGETPYCNPALFSGTSSTGETVNIGACSTGQYGQGGVAGSTNPDKVGIASRCDTSEMAVPNLAGFGTPDVPDGNTVCVALCNDTTEACAATGPSGLPQSCVAFPEVFDPASDFTGICGSICENNFPDICVGNGSAGLGQYCSGPFQFSQTGNSFAFCADRTAPSLAPALFNEQGMATNLGDPCTDNSTQCPEPSFCLDDGAGNAICVVGCTSTSSAPGELCTSLLGSSTATCATGLFQDPTIGVCGDSANN